MSDRRYLESLPHYVYRHISEDGEVLYVGRTMDPKKRPHESTGRAWMKEHRTKVKIQGPMSYEDACQLEADLIEFESPRFNIMNGWSNVKPTSELMNELMDAGMERRHAKYFDELIDAMPPETATRARAQQLAFLRGEATPVSMGEAMDRLWRELHPPA